MSPFSDEDIPEIRPADFQEKFLAVKRELAKVIVGQDRVIEHLLVAVLAGGHVLLTGLPGLGRTLLVKTLAKVLGLTYRRLQFTPDLLPTDIIGAEILEHSQLTGERRFRFFKGPVFANMLLVDEINRSPSRTQSALLEVMQERQVTAGGQTHFLPRPFVLIATENSLDTEGVWSLGEAQVDRFMMSIEQHYPAEGEERRMIHLTTGAARAEVSPVTTPREVLGMQRLARDVPVVPSVRDFALDIVRASRPGEAGAAPQAAGSVRLGASLSSRRRDRMRQVLTGLGPDLTPAEVRSLLSTVLPGGTPAALDDYWRRLSRGAVRAMYRRWPGRRRKLLGDSSLCRLLRTGEGTWRLRLGIDPDTVAACVRAHRELALSTPDRLLKDGSKRGVSRVADGGGRYVVKEFYRPGPWGRWAADCRAWLANWRLEMYGFPVPRHDGWLRAPTGRGYLVMECLAGTSLDRALEREVQSPDRVEALYEGLMAILHQLYHWGIVHEDLKTQNVMVAERPGGGFELKLVDNDAVLFGRRIRARHRLRNRRHLCGTIPAKGDLSARFAAVFDRHFPHGGEG